MSSTRLDVTATDGGPDEGFPPQSASPRSALWRIPMALAGLAFVAFWVWALFFASKEAINRIGDEAWAARAESICAAAKVEREALIDTRMIDPTDPDQRPLVIELAGNLDEATTILDRMLDDVEAVAPNDAKGAEIVPLWLADYRQYLADRRDYTDALRGGDIARFSETALEGIPISEKVATFAGDNEMPSCAPPTDMPA